MSHPGESDADRAAAHRFACVGQDGRTAEDESVTLAVEAPVAVEVNGIGYAVLMATPADLQDLALGFLLTERLIDGPEDVRDVEAVEVDRGILLRALVAPHCADRLNARIRHRTADSACGLCGVENLEQALRPLPVVRGTIPDPDAVFRALSAMREAQPLNRTTGAVHAALACDAEGAILLAREDVGRHNAFDKLIGAMLRAGRGWGDGFALLSSRCSYELVEKAALSGCGALVTVSAATSLAVERAREAGLTLLPLARPDSFLRVP